MKVCWICGSIHTFLYLKHSWCGIRCIGGWMPFKSSTYYINQPVDPCFRSPFELISGIGYSPLDVNNVGKSVSLRTHFWQRLAKKKKQNEFNSVLSSDTSNKNYFRLKSLISFGRSVRRSLEMNESRFFPKPVPIWSLLFGKRLPEFPENFWSIFFFDRTDNMFLGVSCRSLDFICR